MPPQRIVLIGFMGSGKTTVGQRLADHLHWRFADLDQAIQDREHRTVADIFAHSGEPGFRALEHAALQQLLTQPQLVVALGGGAPTNAAVRDLLRATVDTAVIHLDAPFPTLYDRCRTQATDPAAAVRPLLEDRSTTETRYRQRQPLYADFAHLAVNATLPPQAVAESIAALLFPPGKQ